MYNPNRCVQPPRQCSLPPRLPGGSCGRDSVVEQHRRDQRQDQGSSRLDPIRPRSCRGLSTLVTVSKSLSLSQLVTDTATEPRHCFFPFSLFRSEVPRRRSLAERRAELAPRQKSPATRRSPASQRLTKPRRETPVLFVSRLHRRGFRMAMLPALLGRALAHSCAARVACLCCCWVLPGARKELCSAGAAGCCELGV